MNGETKANDIFEPAAAGDGFLDDFYIAVSTSFFLFYICLTTIIA